MQSKCNKNTDELYEIRYLKNIFKFKNLLLMRTNDIY